MYQSPIPAGPRPLLRDPQPPPHPTFTRRLQNPHLGPRQRNGTLGRHRTQLQHRSVLLPSTIPVATPQQRTNQRTATTLAPQKHQPQPQPHTTRVDPRQPQPHAPQTPQLELSPTHLHCTLSQPPVELADPRRLDATTSQQTIRTINSTTQEVIHGSRCVDWNLDAYVDYSVAPGGWVTLLFAPPIQI